MATQPFRDPPSDSLVETAAPRVTLRNSFAHPFDSAIAAARTCYAPRLIGPEDVNDKQRSLIGSATYYGGHHTVYQHAHFEFGLENVSRQFVWSFLHAHPFYNSEQQSQRYVRLDRAQAYVPSAGTESGGTKNFGPAERAIYETAVARAWDYYRELTRLLEPTAREILGDIWHVEPSSHPKRVQKVQRQSEKRAIEVARYVLPVAAFTTMVHTLSGIVLHRLWRMCEACDTPAESRQIVGEMVARVREVDAQFFDRFDSAPMPLDGMPEFAAAVRNGEKFNAGFDARLAGTTSKLIDYSPGCVATIADSYRAVLGITAAECPDAEAIDHLLNPARNAYRRETLNIGVHAPEMRALQHANFTFAKKISHTADSQDQRHRMVPGSRPLLTFADTRSPDYITPMLIRDNPRALEVYERAMHDAWNAKNQLLDRSVPLEAALYLLPNAKSIRLVETGSLLHLLHKWTMRTCFNAQEEIYQASLEEVSQLCAAFPELGRYVGPPCHLRAGISTPICTEGSHFCGVKVWLTFPNVTRRI